MLSCILLPPWLSCFSSAYGAFLTMANLTGSYTHVSEGLNHLLSCVVTNPSCRSEAIVTGNRRQIGLGWTTPRSVQLNHQAAATDAVDANATTRIIAGFVQWSASALVLWFAIFAGKRHGSRGRLGATFARVLVEIDVPDTTLASFTAKIER